MKIYTRSGDTGETSLFGGGRVPKNDPRVAAYGDVDELSSAIGLAIATEPQSLESDVLGSVQRDLFSIGGTLASPAAYKVAKALEKTTIPETRIAELEAAIERVEAGLPELTAFIVPGGCAKSAQLHCARSVCRRAERSVVSLALQEQVPAQVLVFLNRLSDLLFVLARLANHRANIPDTQW
ncbi:MAG: cob(I)yrinic acid a,c-diamide adenosyltransferase [Gemmatimonadota bacterium]|nr:MAG: cob(I)yrinic acid a,c-diamide adenosyltransferase [Gemmatimonadota bacterium]